MKTKQEQIEEMAKERNEIKDIMKLLDKCVSLNPMYKSEVASVLYGNNYRKAEEVRKETEKEIERLKAENEELTKVVSSKVYDLIDNAKEIADAREAWEKQAKIEAVKDFAEKVKAKSYVNDYCREVVEIEKIDELLKEYKE